MGNEVTRLAERNAPAVIDHWEQSYRGTVRDQLCPTATDMELAAFELVCVRTGLDPFARQVYLIKRWNKQANREVAMHQVSIDGMRLTAQRSHEYAGQLGPEWCDSDGVWHDVWMSDEPPAAARVAAMRSTFTHPLWAVAHWREYAQVGKQGQLIGQWGKMPALMLAKVAEALALRKAFPAELSGLYSGEEMAQADNPVVLPPQDVSDRVEYATTLPGDDPDGFDVRAFHASTKTEFGADPVKAEYKARGIERLSDITQEIADEITVSMKAAQDVLDGDEVTE